MDAQCSGILGFFFGHDFEHVFDTDSSAVSSHEASEYVESVCGSYSVTEDRMEAGEDFLRLGSASKRTYVHSICARCGMVVKREENVE